MDKKKEFEEKCYKAYQLQWMMSHGADLSEFLEMITGATCETMATDCDYSVISSEEELKNLMEKSRKDFDDIGFNGSLFVCKNEFLQTEYLDPYYMMDLLSQMPSGACCKKMWSEFTGLKLPDDPENLQADRTYTVPIKDGSLHITMAADPDYPGLDIEYISAKEENIPEDAAFTRPRILIENNENILRALIWGNHTSEDYSIDINFTCIEDTERKNNESN